MANVIMNRLKHPNVGLFGGFDIKSVIEKPGAFKTMDIARASDSTMERLKNPSLRSRYRSIKSKILDPQQHIRKRALAEALKAAGEVYFDGKEDNTGGATNLYANTVSGDKKAGGIGGNILSINKGDSGIEEDDPLGPGFEGDPEGDIGGDPKDQDSGSDADTVKYYPYPIWGIWKGEKVTYVVHIGQGVVIKTKNLRSSMGAAVFVAEMHASSIEEQYGYLTPKGEHMNFIFLNMEMNQWSGILLYTPCRGPMLKFFLVFGLLGCRV